MEKILSVSIAAYNVEKTLQEVLNPFCNCKHKELLDVMIINDGSTDQTSEIAQQYVNMYPDMFRLINKQNGGWGSTLNSGFNYATGKYFKQLDGDDYFSEENLDDFLLFLCEAKADMVYSPFVTFDDKTHAIIRVVGAYSCFPSDEIFYLNELKDFMPAMHDLAIKTDILRNNHITITEHCFYTDVEFVLKTFNCCKTLQYYELPIYYYRLARDGQSMSISGVKKHYKDHQKMLLTMLSYYKQDVTDAGIKRAIRDRLVGVCNMQYSFYCLIPSNAKHKKELIEFDQALKNYPYFYNQIQGRLIRIIRKLNFNGYWLFSKIRTYRDKKFGWNFFEK